MQINSTIHLSEKEHAVVRAAEAIVFGELIDVAVSPGNETQVEINQSQAEFIKVLRSTKETFFNSVVVHNGVPVQAEILGELHGIKYKKKIRFS